MTYVVENWPYLLIAFGGLCAALGGLAASHKNNRFEMEMRTRTQEAIASITGGDSYISLMAIMPPTADRFSVWLESNGKYTVYDVQFSMEDGTAAADFMKNEIAAGRHPTEATMRHVDQSRLVQQLGNIPPSTVIRNAFEFTFPPDKTEYGFTYNLKARNGLVKGYLEFVRNAKGLWYAKSHKAWKNGEVLTDVPNEVPDMVKPEDASAAAEKK